MTQEDKKMEGGRPEILNDKAVAKEARALKKLFRRIEGDDKRKLIGGMLDEAAFLKVAMQQAKAELLAEGLSIETKNASQHFVKAHPAVQVYEKYNKQYTAIINALIPQLPPEEQKTVSRLAALRNNG